MERVYRWRNEVEILPSTHDVLSKLTKKYPLVAITNGNVDCHAIGLSHYFTHTFCAGPDGVAKPDPHLFNKAAKALDVNPESILHVGDHLISDVAGANAAGFNSAWLNTSNRSLRHSRNVESLPDIELSDLRLLLSL
jgi:putative hydrolase of the HAD superfamily